MISAAEPTVQDAEDELGTARVSSLFVGSLEKGLQILQTFDRERRELGLSEVVESSGLDKSSAQRFTYTLHALGFLKKDPVSRKFSLSPKVLGLGFSYLNANGLLEQAMPLLYQANRRCGESLNITERLDTEVVFIARVPGQHVISVDIFLGARVPAYASAPGRAILAHLPEAERKAVLDRTDLQRYTRRTIASRIALERELRAVRGQGYSVAEEQCYLGEISAAAPILDGSGYPVAALNVSVPTSRWSVEAVSKELVPIVVETAAAISQAQGGVSTHRWSGKLAPLKGRPRKSG
jgi:PcaR/PcaU/PobR family beta-ketoadipate pathway transcriptional regulator